MFKMQMLGRFLVLLVAGLLTVGMAGCSNEETETVASTGGMAVIDLNEIAKQTGRDTEITEAIRQHEAKLNQQLLDMQAQAKQQFDDQKAQVELRPALSAEDEQARQAELDRYEKQLNGQLAQAQAEAKRSALAYRQTLAKKFRDDVKKVAREAASDLGTTTILIKQDFLLSVDPTIDITDTVATRMASRPANPKR